MDADTFARWLYDQATEHSVEEKLETFKQGQELLDSFVTKLAFKYRMELDLQARDKFADPCCGGVCKEAHDV